MGRILNFKLILFIGFLSVALSYNHTLAQNQSADISITDVIFPEKIYEKQQAMVEIILVNEGNDDVEPCVFMVEASDGSKVSQLISLPKEESQKAQVQWVPLKNGEVDFTVTVTPPKDVKIENQKKIQLKRKIEVLSAPRDNNK